DYPVLRGHNEKDYGQYDHLELIFGASGNGVLYKREIFDVIGFFDEDFFAYHEDIDLNFRMQLTGLKCLYNPKAKLYHKGGATSKKIPGLHLYLSEKNFSAIVIKNYPANLLGKNFLQINFSRFKFYLGFIKRKNPVNFFYCLRGFLKGIIDIPVNLKKRKSIQSKVTVDSSYIVSLQEGHKI
ncbi:MAG: hypothetical protein ABI462_09670, partial [Ignavibacteria bacterium]